MKRLTLTLAAALLVATPTTALAQEDGGGAGMPAPTCQSNADCDAYFGDGSQCVDGWCQWAPPPGCSSDADCGPDEICRYGYCEDKAGYCQSDADCGQYQACHKANVATPIPMPTEPALPPEDGTDGADGSSEPSSDPAAPMPRPEPTEEAWGTCRLDLAAVPEAPTCRTLCEKAAACAPTSSGTATSSSTEPAPAASSGSGAADEADAPPSADGAPIPDGEPVPMPVDEGDTSIPSEYEIEECVAFCSYTVAVEAGTTELAALTQCVDGAASCESVEATCQGEAEAWFEALEGDEVLVAIGGAMDASGGGMGATAPVGAATGATVQGTGTADAGPTGCSGGGAGSTPSALVLALLALGLMVRRRVA